VSASFAGPGPEARHDRCCQAEPPVAPGHGHGGDAEPAVDQHPAGDGGERRRLRVAADRGEDRLLGVDQHVMGHGGQRSAAVAVAAEPGGPGTGSRCTRWRGRAQPSSGAVSTRLSSSRIHPAASKAASTSSAPGIGTWARGRSPRRAYQSVTVRTAAGRSSGGSPTTSTELVRPVNPPPARSSQSPCHCCSSSRQLRAASRSRATTPGTPFMGEIIRHRHGRTPTASPGHGAREMGPHERATRRARLPRVASYCSSEDRRGRIRPDRGRCPARPREGTP
jgi:hypothetical protein